jgi:ABC-type Fe3+/spermidine/putrescine transport system ATPase subunit
MQEAAGPALAVDGVTQRYGGVTALDDVSLEVRDGEFLTLLGPSGCGKTTLLRTVAGFVTPTAGRVVLHGEDVTRTPPHRRAVNMVFQRPTLFPHLDVQDNVAFGLKLSDVPKAEIARRVHEALALVRLEQVAGRRSHELSGGQMQRIALARAIVNRPKVLLLDEPLSALDLKIRLEMEVELRRVHRETGATFIYVTHDQREALALSDRIAVFQSGRIEQLGTPDDVYRRPASAFAARFVGDANVVPVDVTSTSGPHVEVLMGTTRLRMPAGAEAEVGPAWLVVRPEAIRIGGAPAADSAAVRGVVRDLAFRGTGFTYRVAVPDVAEPLKAEVPAAGETAQEVGADVALSWDLAACRLLRRDER